mmetsp:Transcript_31381/g.50713  ORF Transcript_31381/g.50713 Transcript_31381/m.50713 type:complete len:505 (+) Transcript_31381:1-1515(+)
MESYGALLSIALRLALASASTCFVSTPGGLSAARGSALWSSSGICRRSLRQTRSVAASVFGTRMQGGMAADEDDWYDSEKWESFKKSGARESGTRAAKDADGSTSSSDSTRGDVSANVQREQRGGERQKGTNPNVEWLRIAGCDVCLPKDRKKPMDGQRFSGLVHFIGGAFVGTLPRQAYGVLIESLVAKGRLVVVATPCSGLAGMDHYKAAYEAAFKFQTACSVLRKDLGPEIFDADKLPTIGVAHSLGCKIQVLMNSIQDTREAAGRERAANVHLAFNNFAADESIPILKQLGKLQQDVSAGIAAAAPVFDQISTFASELKSTSAFKDVLGTPSANQAFSFLEDLSRVGKTAAANMGAELLDEFSPSPSDTMRILTEEYAVNRNLVIKFADDAIDQSIPLCEKLRDKFTGPNGSGGRLDLKSLSGSHVTPNTPDLRDLAEGRTNLQDFEDVLGQTSREQAKEKMDEVDRCAATVVEFLKDEFARDWLRPPGGNRRRVGASDV